MFKVLLVSSLLFLNCAIGQNSFQDLNNFLHFNSISSIRESNNLKNRMGGVFLPDLFSYFFKVKDAIDFLKNNIDDLTLRANDKLEIGEEIVNFDENEVPDFYNFITKMNNYMSNYSFENYNLLVTDLNNFDAIKTSLLNYISGIKDSFIEGSIAFKNDLDPVILANLNQLRSEIYTISNCILDQDYWNKSNDIITQIQNLLPKGTKSISMFESFNEDLREIKGVVAYLQNLILR